MRNYLKAILADTSGATAIEYGLILALVFLAIIAAVAGVGTETIVLWDTVSAKMVEAGGS